MQVPLIQSIYDKLGHTSVTVVQCCCHILLTSVEQGLLHLTGLLNGLLNIMPSTRLVYNNINAPLFKQQNPVAVFT